MSYEPDTKEVSVVANAIAWSLYSHGEPEVHITDEQMDGVLAAADNAMQALQAYREYAQKSSV